MSQGKKWVVVQDTCVKHVWKCRNSKCAASVLPPGWYEKNGTPVCECDEDMFYSRTEVAMNPTTRRRGAREDRT